MSLISGYDNDIFISYHRLDNQPIIDEEKGWVDVLQARLQIRLEQLLGEQPSIWRDPMLFGSQGINDILTRSLPKSAILICILSPAYINSKWCLHELSGFITQQGHKRGIVIDGKSRIFKVLKTPVPDDKHPPELRDILGYKFYEIDQTGRAREFDAWIGSNEDLRYWERLDDLAFDLKTMITHMQQQHSNQD